MPRPLKCRRIQCQPVSVFFKPCGVPSRLVKENTLTLDELEAIRLSDFEGFYQEQAAARMNISRQTLGNILASARKKIADSLINGKALKIEGGEVQHADSWFCCSRCQHVLKQPHQSENPMKCPKCDNHWTQMNPNHPVQGKGRCNRHRN